jgi:ribonuclease-3
MVPRKGEWNLQALEEKIGYQFADRTLLEKALTHPSYMESNHAEWQRLEFIGDAVINFFVSKGIFKKFPDMDEGGMTLLRSRLVGNDYLAKVAKRLKIDEFIRIGEREEKEGGRRKISILGNTVETLVGAIFLDNGEISAENFVKKHILRYGLRLKGVLDPKTALQEIATKRFGIFPRYTIVSEKGPPHRKTFRAKVMVRDLVAYGIASSKREAQKRAAKNLLKKIKEV